MFRRLLSSLLFLIGISIAGYGVYLTYFGNPKAFIAQFAWWPSIGVLAVFWLDHKLLRNQNKNLAEQTRFKSDFIGVLSHDIKTPLSRIKAMVDILTTDTSHLKYEHKMALVQIEKSQLELSNFIDNMVQMSHLEGGQLNLKLRTADINKVITEVVTSLKFQASDKNIEIVTELEPIFSFKFDPVLVKQIIVNIVENALKYSPDNTRVFITSEDKDNEVILQVRDEGHGIASKDLPHIFDRYFRSNSAKTTSTKSSGLGLYLAKEFVKLHGGLLSASSDEGKGSTFTLRLPKQSGALS
jgi:signal transduction histidine kinase